MFLTLRRAKDTVRDEEGATLIEFTLAGAFMILLLGAIFDLGLALHNYTLLQHVTEEAAREMAIRLGARNKDCDQVPWLLNFYATRRLRDDLRVDVKDGPNWQVQLGGVVVRVFRDPITGSEIPVREYNILRLNGSFSSGCYFICQLSPDAFTVAASHQVTLESGVNCGANWSSDRGWY